MERRGASGCEGPRTAEAVGDWFGVVAVAPANGLPLLVHIQRDDSGILNGTMDRPAQGERGLPLAEITDRGPHLTFALRLLALRDSL
jgi:hypothetical protein